MRQVEELRQKSRPDGRPFRSLAALERRAYSMVQAIAIAERSDPAAVRAFTWRDEADLGWFFSEGLSAFERSTFGGQLERVEQFAFDPDNNRIPSPSTKADSGWRFRQLRCHIEAKTIAQELADAIRGLIDWDDHDPNLTARPTSGQGKKAGKREQGYVPDHNSLMRFAQVSRRLSRINLSHRRALELYFGLEGARWIGKRAGQIMVLFAETRSGKRLLERFGQRDDGKPVERVAAIWARNSGSKAQECTALLQSAETQSYALLASSKAAYGEAG